MFSVLIPLAEGFEELEAITIVDLLRRAEINVVTAGLKEGAVKASRGTVHLPDTTLDEALKREYDMVVLPGGLLGSDYLNADPRIHTILKKTADADKYTAAICAAPKVLADAGLLNNKKATSYPTCLDGTLANIQPDAVVQDGKVITSRGPGTAMDFSLTLIETLSGREKRDEIEAQLVRS